MSKEDDRLLALQLTLASETNTLEIAEKYADYLSTGSRWRATCLKHAVSFGGYLDSVEDCDRVIKLANRFVEFLEK